MYGTAIIHHARSRVLVFYAHWPALTCFLEPGGAVSAASPPAISLLYGMLHSGGRPVLVPRGVHAAKCPAEGLGHALRFPWTLARIGGSAVPHDMIRPSAPGAITDS